MRKRPNWEDYFLGLAFIASFRSPDEHTQHGCVLVDWNKKIVIGTGYNGPLKTIPNDKIPQTRPEKYDFYIHAEENAILNCLKKPDDSSYFVAFVTGKCCNFCFQKLLQFGIHEIVMASRKGTNKETEESDRIFNFIIENCNPSPKIKFKDFDSSWILEGLTGLVFGSTVGWSGLESESPFWPSGKKY